MILSFIKNDIWLKKKKKIFLDGTLFFYVISCVFWFHCIEIVSIPAPGGGGTQLYFCGYVPHGFPKVGSRERIFLEK